MGHSSPPTTDRPAGVPTDSFAGTNLYPVPEPSRRYPWGRTVSLLEIPLIMTASHLLYHLEGRFWIARRGAGGIYLHACLTRDGWIMANGARFLAVPCLIVAAADLVRALIDDTAEHREWAKAALIASCDCVEVVRQGVINHG